jgi:hypothetical protein
MTTAPARCAGCGAPLRRKKIAWCWRCERERVKARCPGCGRLRLLVPEAGRCVICSRTCADCGKVVRPAGRDRCSRCHRRAEPSRACRGCGKLTVIVAHGLCDNCWQQDPARLAGQVERLAARLTEPPAWLAGFAGHAAARHSVGRTSKMISRLGRLLAGTDKATPQAILEKAIQPGRQSPGPLARALEDFFTDSGLAFPVDHPARRQAARRQRRIEQTPQAAAPRGGPLGRRHDQRPAAGTAGRHPPALRPHHHRRAVRPQGPRPLPDSRTGQDRLGHRPGRRPGGIPGPPAGQPGTAADDPAVVLPLGDGKPPGPRRPRRPAPGHPAPRLPLPHPARRRTAPPVPPLDHRRGRPPARGPDRAAGPAARRVFPGASQPHARRHRRRRARHHARAPAAPGPARPGHLAGAAGLPGPPRTARHA